MTNGSDRLDRIEGILERVAGDLEKVTGSLRALDGRLHEMAARQQYHDEAFERHDVEMKSIREAQAVDGEHIRALVHIAELHQRRLEGLEGGEAA